jgi:hypothetical protein
MSKSTVADIALYLCPVCDLRMGCGEEAGSGALNVTKYLPFYAKAAKPQFIEGVRIGSGCENWPL